MTGTNERRTIWPRNINSSLDRPPATWKREYRTAGLIIVLYPDVACDRCISLRPERLSTAIVRPALCMAKDCATGQLVSDEGGVDGCMFRSRHRLIRITAAPPHRIELSAGNVSRHRQPAAVFSGLRNRISRICFILEKCRLLKYLKFEPWIPDSFLHKSLKCQYPCTFVREIVLRLRLCALGSIHMASII